MVQISGEGLKQAAKNIAGVMPQVLAIATKIVASIATLRICSKLTPHIYN